MQCVDQVIINNKPCAQCDCRYYINYTVDLNCTHIAILKNGNMKLEQISDRLHLTAARIKQIEDESFAKLLKKKSLLKILE